MTSLGKIVLTTLLVSTSSWAKFSERLCVEKSVTFYDIIWGARSYAFTLSGTQKSLIDGKEYPTSQYYGESLSGVGFSFKFSPKDECFELQFARPDRANLNRKVRGQEAMSMLAPLLAEAKQFARQQAEEQQKQTTRKEGMFE